jgi:hypothetical protein
MRFRIPIAVSVWIAAGALSACNPGQRTEHGTTATTKAEAKLVAFAAPDETKAPAAPLKSFEGEVDLTVDSARANGTQRVQAQVKGDRVRFTLPASSNLDRPVDAVVDGSAKKAFLIFPADKVAAEIDASKVKPNPAAVRERAETAQRNWTVQDTHAKSEVAGHSCEVWRVDRKDSEARIDACLATDLPYVDLEKVIPAGWLPETWSDKLEHAALPLRILDFDAKGQQTLKVEVTRIEKKTVPDNVVTVPAGYKIVQLPVLTTNGLPAIPGFPSTGE